jgi:MFS family permease
MQEKPDMTNERALFAASCISMLTTSMIFSVRADIVSPVAQQFFLTNEMVGWTISSVFWGFTLGIIVCALVVDIIGMKVLHIVSGLGYIIGIALLLMAPVPQAKGADVTSVFDTPGTTVLYAGFLLTGISQGIVEGVVNPLIATLYRGQKTRMLTILHAWYPGGLIVGGLVAWVLSQWGAGWQIKIMTVIVPSAVYLMISLMQPYPETERVSSRVPASEMFREAFRPLFLLLLAIMWITAATELGPDQWFAKIMSDLVPALGNNAILFLAYTAGIMFVLRMFCADVAHRISPFITLAICSAFAAAGLFLLSTLTADTAGVVWFALAGATLFAVGKTFYLPTMLGVTNELFPKGGALLINLMGGSGMLSVMLALPLIGRAIDTYDSATALRYLAVLPCILIIVFGLMATAFWRRGGYKPVKLDVVADAVAMQPHQH